MKPILKTAYRNLPLSLPEAQCDFMEELATLLGISRNTCLCLALRMGAPLLHRHAECMRESVRSAVDGISGAFSGPPGKSSEIVGAAEIEALEAINATNERKKRRHKS